MRTLETQITWFGRIQLALAGAILVAVVTFYLVWYRPAISHWRDLQSEIDTKNHNLEASRSKAGELPTVATEVERLRQRLDRFDRQIPRYQELPQFLKSLELLKQETSLTRCNLKPEAPRQLDAYAEQAIRIDLEGQFTDVADFLRKVEEMERLTRVRRLTVRTTDPTNGTVEVQMDVSIFFLEG